MKDIAWFSTVAEGNEFIEGFKERSPDCYISPLMQEDAGYTVEYEIPGTLKSETEGVDSN